MNLEDEEYHYSKLKTKGKNQTYLPKLEFLELKPRTRRQGKCVGAALEYCDLFEYNVQMDKSEEHQAYTFISNDIWFHLANYIAPEDVQNYSLICSQSANSVNSCRFWLQMYRRHCQQTTGNSKKWILQLPEHLQMEHMKDCDRNTLRQRVIQALFHCYQPFKERLQKRYSLEMLVGRTYVSSWHKQVQCVWIMCFKFKLNFPINSATTATQKFQKKLENNENDTATDSVVNDWECLADEENNNLSHFKNTASSSTSTINDLDGTIILVICCDRFIPFPSDIVYNHATSAFRFAASRELLSTDMRSINLELDFVSGTRDQTITVKYTKIQKFKVLPWWHPDFRILNKC
ncbi:transmembrane protein 183 [Calliphora vicina]|uniref:transmembrane protein 183 n=1 Tax=Calliphora vicina TaxID=7373 RepID=UPI00325A7B14